MNVVLATYTCTDECQVCLLTVSATKFVNSCNGMRVCVTLLQLNCYGSVARTAQS